MKLKITLAVLLLLLVLGSLAGVKALQIRKLIAAGKTFTPPPESISATVATEEKWPSTLTAIGSIAAVQGVTITPDIPGTVREVAFESGAVVAKGDLLVRLDITSEEAQLRAIEAQLELAKINLGRTQKLRAENTVAQAELDTAEATSSRGRPTPTTSARPSRRRPSARLSPDASASAKSTSGNISRPPSPSFRSSPSNRSMRISPCPSMIWPGSKPGCSSGSRRMPTRAVFSRAN